MDVAICQRFREIVRQQAGIEIGSNKGALVSSRVSQRLRDLRLESAKDYLKLLETDTSGREMVRFLDVMTTNFTSFMREPDHFELLAKLLTGWADKGARRIRIWCAASSSGEEPYSILITALDALQGRNVDFRLLATDLSTKVLGQASRGHYAPDRVSCLDAGQLQRYFDKRADDSGRVQYEVKPTVRRLVTFARLNLATPPFPMKGPFDVIFIRNVMIYFPTPVRQNLISEAERLLGPGGRLLTGHTETLTGLRTGLKLEKASVFRKKS